MQNALLYLIWPTVDPTSASATCTNSANKSEKKSEIIWSTQTHWDMNGHHNLNFQILGTKKIILCAPEIGRLAQVHQTQEVELSQTPSQQLLLYIMPHCQHIHRFIELNSTKHSTQLNSTKLYSTQLNSTQLNSTQLNSTHETKRNSRNWTELKSIQFNSTQLNSTQLNSTQLTKLNCWTELNWTELTKRNWTELNWTQRNWIELIPFNAFIPSSQVITLMHSSRWMSHTRIVLSSDPVATWPPGREVIHRIQPTDRIVLEIEH